MAVFGRRRRREDDGEFGGASLRACFLALLRADPDWAEEKLVERGAWGTGLHEVMAHNVEELAEAAPPERALLRARVLAAAASESWRSCVDGRGQTLLARAWWELQTIGERDEAWLESALSVTAHVDFAAYRELARLSDPFWRARFLETSISAAGRHRDWPTRF